MYAGAHSGVRPSPSVPPKIKSAKPKGAARSAEFAGQRKDLGVESGDPKPTECQDADEGQVIGGQPHERRENGRQSQATDDQPAPSHAVGPQAHERLADIAYRNDGTQKPNLRQAQPQVDLQQGQQRGQHRGVAIDAKVRERDNEQAEFLHPSSLNPNPRSVQTAAEAKGTERTECRESRADVEGQGGIDLDQVAAEQAADHHRAAPSEVAQADEAIFFFGSGDVVDEPGDQRRDSPRRSRESGAAGKEADEGIVPQGQSQGS